ncbi:MAG: hypothetical protein COU72_02215, partial [Parcubacteria group bacterium CG10_big_fil_rev_8_21_14_0_10_41_35]
MNKEGVPKIDRSNIEDAEFVDIPEEEQILLPRSAESPSPEAEELKQEQNNEEVHPAPESESSLESLIARAKTVVASVSDKEKSYSQIRAAIGEINKAVSDLERLNKISQKRRNGAWTVSVGVAEARAKNAILVIETNPERKPKQSIKREAKPKSGKGAQTEEKTIEPEIASEQVAESELVSTDAQHEQPQIEKIEDPGKEQTKEFLDSSLENKEQLINRAEEQLNLLIQNVQKAKGLPNAKPIVSQASACIGRMSELRALSEIGKQDLNSLRALINTLSWYASVDLNNNEPVIEYDEASGEEIATNRTKSNIMTEALSGVQGSHGHLERLNNLITEIIASHDLGAEHQASTEQMARQDMRAGLGQKESAEVKDAAPNETAENVSENLLKKRESLKADYAKNNEEIAKNKEEISELEGKLAALKAQESTTNDLADTEEQKEAAEELETEEIKPKKELDEETAKLFDTLDEFAKDVPDFKKPAKKLRQEAETGFLSDSDMDRIRVVVENAKTDGLVFGYAKILEITVFAAHMAKFGVELQNGDRISPEEFIEDKKAIDKSIDSFLLPAYTKLRAWDKYASQHNKKNYEVMKNSSVSVDVIFEYIDKLEMKIKNYNAFLSDCENKVSVSTRTRESYKYDLKNAIDLGNLPSVLNLDRMNDVPDAGEPDNENKEHEQNDARAQEQEKEDLRQYIVDAESADFEKENKAEPKVAPDDETEEEIHLSEKEEELLDLWRNSPEKLGQQPGVVRVGNVNELKRFRNASIEAMFKPATSGIFMFLPTRDNEYAAVTRDGLLYDKVIIEIGGIEEIFDMQGYDSKKKYELKQVDIIKPPHFKKEGDVFKLIEKGKIVFGVDRIIKPKELEKEEAAEELEREEQAEPEKDKIKVKELRADLLGRKKEL